LLFQIHAFAASVLFAM
jgi:hypothetical protein